jgi:hypothetical protein
MHGDASERIWGLFESLMHGDDDDSSLVLAPQETST